MDLLGRHRGRGVLGDEESVPGLAVRQRRPGDARARARQVLVVHEGAQPPVRGHQLVADRGGVCGGQPFTVGGAEPRRKIPDRSVVVALRGVVDDHRVELRQHLLHDRPRLNHALRHAFAHVDDRLVDPDDEAVETHEPLVVVLDGREGLRIGARAERRHRRLEPAGLVDRDEVIRETLGLERALAFPQEDLERDAVRSVERVGVDPPGGGQVSLVQLVLPGALLGSDVVRQPIVVAVIADEGREKRIQLEQLLEIAIEQRGELRVGAGDRRCGWGRRAPREEPGIRWHRRQAGRRQS